MKWLMKEPKYGDMIRVEVGTIYHFGIYVSDDEVIQFGLAPSQRAKLRDCDVEVLSSDIDAFLAGGFLEVCVFNFIEKKKNRKPDEVVSYARSKLGTRGYNIIYNNCEHFANECISGKRISHQADDVRAMFRNMDIVDIYLAELPEREPVEKLSCTIRQDEIDSVSNENVKRQKYYVWQLLGFGLQRSFGVKISDLDFTRADSGRYSCDRFEFSLSHSGKALAVAVSRKRVGVDIEEIGTSIHKNTPERILNSDEYSLYAEKSSDEQQKYLIGLWTAKEALFKESHGDKFNPLLQDTGKGGFRTYEKNIGENLYCLSVATSTPEKIRIFENIKL